MNRLDRMATRRKLLIAFGAGALAASLSGFAQQKGKMWRIGYIAAHAPPASPDSGNPGEFLRGMRDLGYVEGRNFVVDWRFAEGKYDRLPGFAVELVKLNVDVIVAAPSPAIRAAQQATATIPIVMADTGDPVGAGFVASLARPGGNITGLSNIGGEISAKHLELLLAIAPKLLRVAVLGNPGSTTHSAILKNVATSAQKFGIQVVSVEAGTLEEIERGFLSMRRERADAVIIGADQFLSSHKKQIADLAAKYRMPSIFGSPGYAQAGGLIDYSQGTRGENYRRAAAYVDKILKGAKPGDLPVEQPTKFEMTINSRTAKALSLTIPQSLVIRADKMIE